MTGLPAGDHTQFELAAQLLEDALHDDMKGYLADILSPGAVRPALLPSATAIHLTRGRGGGSYTTLAFVGYPHDCGRCFEVAHASSTVFFVPNMRAPQCAMSLRFGLATPAPKRK